MTAVPFSPVENFVLSGLESPMSRAPSPPLAVTVPPEMVTTRSRMSLPLLLPMPAPLPPVPVLPVEVTVPPEMVMLLLPLMPAPPFVPVELTVPLEMVTLPP